MSISENTKNVYRSKRNRIVQGIEKGLYNEKELPLALKQVEELNAKLGEDNSTVRGPGRPRKHVRIPSAEELQTTGTQMDQSPEALTRRVEASEAALTSMQKVAARLKKTPEQMQEENRVRNEQAGLKARADALKKRIADALDAAEVIKGGELTDEEIGDVRRKTRKVFEFEVETERLYDVPYRKQEPVILTEEDLPNDVPAFNANEIVTWNEQNDVELEKRRQAEEEFHKRGGEKGKATGT